MTDLAVMFVHPSDEAYGADRVLLQMAVGLRRRGWRIRVLLSDDQPPGWLSSRLAEESIAVARGPLAPARRRYLRIRGLVEYIRRLRRARAWIRSEASAFSPNVIHVNTTALLVGALLGRPRDARIVWHVHELVTRPRFVNWVFRFAPALTATRVVAISRAVRDHVSIPLVGHRNVILVQNGIEDRPAVPLPPSDSPLVAFAGRINRWKGWDVFLDAAAVVAPEFPTARFLVAGDTAPGEEWRTDSLQARLGRLGIADRVDVVGYSDDVPGLLDKAAIVVVPSIWPEPFGLITLEGMRAGRAVIATAQGGALDLIEDGRSGLLVAPGDTGALARAIRSLLADPGMRAELGDAARRRALGRFSETRFIDGIERVYRSALALN
jgi:glycosyltransferase involved in cell wall biosynthesis